MNAKIVGRLPRLRNPFERLAFEAFWVPSAANEAPVAWVHKRGEVDSE